MNATAIAEVPKEPDRESIAGRVRPRVLIVDDDSNVRAIITEFLELFDFDVSQAADGWMAMKLFRHHAFDLVITDLQMPIMDGFSLMIRIKEVSADTPVVVITGQCQAEIADSEAIKHAATILFKPIDLRELKAILDATVYEQSKAI